MLKVEFHCHTYASKDSLVRPADLVRRCRERGIDRVVITDHNSIAGALEAHRIDPELVIVGEEIRTAVGELLCAFVKEEIPRGLQPKEALKRLKDQGAFVSVSHPFDRERSPWFAEGLDEIRDEIDAIEIFNALCLLQRFNQQAADYARTWGLAGTAGSDAHTLAEIGRATMLLPEFEDAASLRASMKAVQYDLQRSGLWARFGSQYASTVKTLRGHARQT